MPRGKRKNDKDEDAGQDAGDEGRENKDADPVLMARLKGILEEYDNEVEARCLHMQTQADGLVMGLRNSLHMELMKLPKRVRTMPLSQFLKEQPELRPLGSSAANTSVAPTPARGGDAAKITLKLQGGRALDLDASMVSSLDARTKEEAKARLLSLQSEVQTLMAALR